MVAQYSNSGSNPMDKLNGFFGALTGKSPHHIFDNIVI